MFPFPSYMGPEGRSEDVPDNWLNAVDRYGLHNPRFDSLLQAPADENQLAHLRLLSDKHSDVIYGLPANKRHKDLTKRLLSSLICDPTMTQQCLKNDHIVTKAIYNIISRQAPITTGRQIKTITRKLKQ